MLLLLVVLYGRFIGEQDALRPSSLLTLAYPAYTEYVNIHRHMPAYAVITTVYDMNLRT